MANREITLPTPRCPFCFAVMEEAQLNITEKGLEETWGCDSCHTLHTFPARIEFVMLVGASNLLPTAHKTLYLPK